MRDHLGSVREVTDSSGNVVSRYDYDPWGRQTVVTGTTVFDIGYAGYWNLHSAGSILNLKLNLTWYRAYSLELGRWLSRDPIGEEGGWNLYRYFENNPIQKIDPKELFPWGRAGPGGEVCNLSSRCIIYSYDTAWFSGNEMNYELLKSGQCSASFRDADYGSDGDN